jgi:hypothetical protein
MDLQCCIFPYRTCQSDMSSLYPCVGWFTTRPQQTSCGLQQPKCPVSRFMPWVKCFYRREWMIRTNDTFRCRLRDGSDNILRQAVSHRDVIIETARRANTVRSLQPCATQHQKHLLRRPGNCSSQHKIAPQYGYAKDIQMGRHLITRKWTLTDKSECAWRELSLSTVSRQTPSSGFPYVGTWFKFWRKENRQ